MEQIQIHTKHVTTEAEVGVVHPQTKERQGLPATTGSEREARKHFLLEPAEEAPPC